MTQDLQLHDCQPRDCQPNDTRPSDLLLHVHSHRSPGGLDKALWSITYPTLLRAFPAGATESAPKNAVPPTYIPPVAATP
jgi:hypothetical protein